MIRQNMFNIFHHPFFLIFFGIIHFQIFCIRFTLDFWWTLLIIFLAFCVVFFIVVLFVFVLCLVCTMLPVSLDCPLLIAHSVFSNVFTSSCLQEGSCLINVICICLRIVVSNTYYGVFFVLFFFVLCTLYMLPVSLDCPLLIVPSVFSNVCLQYFNLVKRSNLLTNIDKNIQSLLICIYRSTTQNFTFDVLMTDILKLTSLLLLTYVELYNSSFRYMFYLFLFNFV